MRRVMVTRLVKKLGVITLSLVACLVLSRSDLVHALLNRVLGHDVHSDFGPPHHYIPHIDPDHGCGPITLSLVSHLLDQPIQLAEANRMLSPNALGQTSMGELVDGLKQAGLFALAVRLNGPALEVSNTPVILYVRQSHFVVVLPLDQNELLVMDPPFGPKRRTLRELQRYWRGEAVVISKHKATFDEMLARWNLGQISGS